MVRGEVEEMMSRLLVARLYCLYLFPQFNPENEMRASGMEGRKGTERKKHENENCTAYYYRRGWSSRWAERSQWYEERWRG